MTSAILPNLFNPRLRDLRDWESIARNAQQSLQAEVSLLTADLDKTDA